MGHPAEIKPPRPRATCLLIEDSEFDQRRIARVLQRSIPMNLLVANSLEVARFILSRRKVDLVLLDNKLPDGLGIDFASELRLRPHTAKVPVLMVSDWPTPFMYDKAMEAKVARVLSKDDFQPSHVRDALRFGRVRSASTH